MNSTTVTPRKIPKKFILLANQWIASTTGVTHTIPLRLRKRSIESYITLNDGRTCITMNSKDEWMVQETPEQIDALLDKQK